MAGHTHGGQVSLPWFGTPVPTSETGLPIARGSWADHGTQLFITSGIGTTSLPFRLGVTPEIVLLNLTPPARAVSQAGR